MPVTPYPRLPDTTVTVAANLTTNNETNAADIVGTWTFNGWESSDVTITGAGDTFKMPIYDVAITGSWTFTPNPPYNVTYTVTDSGDGQPDPATISNMPTTPKEEYEGARVTVVSNLTTTATTNATDIVGTWTFNGWDSSDVTIAGAGDTFKMPCYDVEITGSWTFTPNVYNVTYTVTDSGDGQPDPATISNMPTTPKEEYEGARVTVASNPTTTSTTNATGIVGTWIFRWTSNTPNVTISGAGDNFTMPGEDVAIAGSWTFTPNVYTVTYKVVNGTWDGTDSADKTEDVVHGQLPVSVPTGMQGTSPMYTHNNGSW
ncbi:MAG: SHIRT domain-containing protein, partial [Methanimicrococcus sp.]|nr:SHIRT domain-containing protein [Methanimicrococcus sp.]